MKSTGEVRGVDGLGRIVIPKSIRKHFHVVDNEDSFEIFVDGDKIVLQKYEPSCSFCDNVGGVILFKGRKICKACIGEIKELSE